MFTKTPYEHPGIKLSSYIQGCGAARRYIYPKKQSSTNQTKRQIIINKYTYNISFIIIKYKIIVKRNKNGHLTFLLMSIVLLCFLNGT